MSKQSPFHESKYQFKKGAKGCCPLVDVTIGKSQKTITVLADTGCSVGLAILNNQITGLELGEKISDDSYGITVADGHKIEADLYKANICLNGITEKVAILVLNPSKFTVDPDAPQTIAYLGRGFLDKFNVLFQGKEQKVAFFQP